MVRGELGDPAMTVHGQHLCHMSVVVACCGAYQLLLYERLQLIFGLVASCSVMSSVQTTKLRLFPEIQRGRCSRQYSERPIDEYFASTWLE